MRVDRPPPGDELNEGEVVTPRDAASIIVLREGEDGAEVLLVRRNPEQRFMGGAWVFPGGGVDAGEEPAQAAVRELREEAGIALPADAEVVPFSRWIAPTAVRVRFDTRFFAVEAPAGARAVPDGSECVDARWLTPADALAAYVRGDLLLVFPTIKHLERLAETPSVAATLEGARGRTIEAITPRVRMRDGQADLLLPGEPGYEDA